MRTVLLVLFIGGIFTAATGQSITVGSYEDELLRVLQLNGSLKHRYSLAVRPVPYSAIAADSNALLFYNPTSTNPNKPKLQFIPAEIALKFTSSHPYGWNDYGLVAAKGLQQLTRMGLFAKVGPFEIQAAPEFVSAQNAPYRTNSSFGPASFASYNRVLPGQSYVKAIFAGLAMGLSSENLWWGPGQFNSLLMSNNAPGFPHLVFHTTRPKNIGIGFLEWHLVSGKLRDDNHLPYENGYQKLADATIPYMVGANNSRMRYFNGLSVSYNPKWIKGLFVGLNRTFQIYEDRIGINQQGFFEKYLPVFGTIFKAGTVNENEVERDQLLSVFIRGLFTQSKFEAYAEYGFNDHSVDLRDFLLSPYHGRTYTVGIKKLLQARKNMYYMQAELSQLAQSPDFFPREAGNWYIHHYVVAGYTNRNQVMGAGVGGGNNVQTFQLSELNAKGNKGLILQRVERDPLYHSNKWTDFSAGLFKHWNGPRFQLGARLQLILSQNQMWEAGNHRWNLLGMFNARYKFNTGPKSRN